MRVTELAEDQLTYPRRHGSSPKSNDLTSKLSFVALNGCSSREIGFDIDPRTAVPTLDVRSNHKQGRIAATLIVQFK